MFNKLMIFFSIIVILVTINNSYHFHNTHADEHHENFHYHQVEPDFYDATTEHSSFHHAQHSHYLDNIGIISSVILVLLFSYISFSFLLLLKMKISAKYNLKVIFCRYLFTYPPPLLIRYILFHAPPK